MSSKGLEAHVISSLFALFRVMHVGCGVDERTGMLGGTYGYHGKRGVSGWDVIDDREIAFVRKNCIWFGAGEMNALLFFSW